MKTFAPRTFFAAAFGSLTRRKDGIPATKNTCTLLRLEWNGVFCVYCVGVNMKILVCFLAFLSVFAAVLHARGGRETMEFGIGWHRVSDSASVRGYSEGEFIDFELVDVYSGLQLDIAGTNWFLGNFGLATNVGFFLPSSVRQDTAVGSLSMTETLGRSDFDSLWGMDTFIGPVFLVHDSGFIRIPVAAGFHWHWLFMEESEWHNGLLRSTVSTLTALGAGLNVSAEVVLHPNIYLWGRLQGWYAFGTIFRVEGTRIPRSNWNTWGIKPVAIGIGFQR